jgi:predicted acylesterase/phospholipase RssA
MVDSPKRALVMTGGAARGAFFLGVVEALVLDRQLDFAVLAGVSVGALIAANLSQAPLDARQDHSRQALAECNRALAKAVRARLPRQAWLRYWPMFGQRRRRVLRDIVESTVAIERIRSSGRRFLSGAVDLRTGAWRLRDEKSLSSVDELMGMMSLPLLDPPVVVGSELWVDGVLRRTAPIDEVLLEDVDELYIVSAGSAPIGPTLRARGAFRALAIALGELAYDKEIRLAYLAERVLGRPRVTLIRPSKALNAHLTLSPRDFKFAMAHGRSQALLATSIGGGPIADEGEILGTELPATIQNMLTRSRSSPPPPNGTPRSPLGSHLARVDE